MKKLSGSYRTEDGNAQIDWELEEKETDPRKLHVAAVKHGRMALPVFSATGEYDHSSGQCLDEIAVAYPKDQTVQEIVGVWREYHLNDLKAGTPEQERAVKEWLAAGNRYDYSKACEMLKARGLYEVQLTREQEQGGLHAMGGFENICHPVTHRIIYTYGNRWIYSPIPDAVYDKIVSWAELPSRKPLHQDKAGAWLREHGLKLRITLSDTKPAPFDHVGRHYRITLIREATKGARLVWDFWGSQNDMARSADPTPYDVLYCLASDITIPATFEDFCAEFGDNPDSIKAKQTFNRGSRFAGRVRGFLTEEEIESIQAIR